MGALILNTWKSHANGLRNEDAVVPTGLGNTAGLWYSNSREYRDHSEKFQICQRDGTCTAGCVLQEKEGLLELVEKGKKTRTEKNGQIASIEGCNRRDENPAVGAHKQCDREVFLLIFHDM
ncbi:hypothetical protein AB3S75_033201 [Citrus x aurantiifolia]